MRLQLSVKISTFLLAVMVIGCSTQNEEQESTKSGTDVENNASAYTSPTVKKDQTTSAPAIEKQSSMRTLLINAGKYQLQNSKLTPGTRIEDMQLRESAVVTNKIVVVVKSPTSSQTVVSPELLKSRVDGNPVVKKPVSYTHLTLPTRS